MVSCMHGDCDQLNTCPDTMALCRFTECCRATGMWGICWHGCILRDTPSGRCENAHGRAARAYRDFPYHGCAMDRREGAFDVVLLSHLPLLDFHLPLARTRMYGIIFLSRSLLIMSFCPIFLFLISSLLMRTSTETCTLPHAGYDALAHTQTIGLTRCTRVLF